MITTFLGTKYTATFLKAVLEKKYVFTFEAQIHKYSTTWQCSMMFLLVIASLS